MIEIDNGVVMYSRATTGKIISWEIMVEGNSNETFDVITFSGELTGKKTKHSYNVSEGKNISKANQTSSRQQAIKEAMALVEKKYKNGYRTLEQLEVIVDYRNDLAHYSYWINGEPNSDNTIESTVLGEVLDVAISKYRMDAEDQLKPMLAKPYINTKNGKVVAKFPCFVQPKINGFRAIIRYEPDFKVRDIFDTKVRVRSKNGLDYPLMRPIARHFKDYIYEALSTETAHHLIGQKGLTIEDIVFDGELYFDGAEFLSEITKAVKGKGGVPDENTHKIKFCCFDLSIPQVPQFERDIIREWLMDFISKNYSLPRSMDLRYLPHPDFDNCITHSVTDRIVHVGKAVVNSDEHVQRLCDQMIARGFEGIITRDPNANYNFGQRKVNMTKLKRLKHEEYEIVDVVPEDKHPERGKFVCRTKPTTQTRGVEFKVSYQNTIEAKEEILVNRENYIGKMITLGFYEYTENGIPFHPSETTVRDYE